MSEIFPYVTVFPRASSVYLFQHSYEEAQCTFAWHRVSEVNENPTKNHKRRKESWRGVQGRYRRLRKNTEKT